MPCGSPLLDHPKEKFLEDSKDNFIILFASSNPSGAAFPLIPPLVRLGRFIVTHNISQ
jgi:hypothetical protein